MKCKYSLYVLIVIFFKLFSNSESNVYILIHGTWATDERWHQFKSEFHSNLAKSVSHQNSKVLNFDWSGKADHIHRMHAGINLAQLIESYPDNTNIRIVAHSHGANVGTIASQQLGRRNNKKIIKSFHAFGAPVDASRYMPNMDVIQHYFNFYSLKDIIQPVFGLYERVLPKHERIANIRLFINNYEPTHIQIHSPIIALWLNQIEAHFTSSINNLKFTDEHVIYLYENQLPLYLNQHNLNTVANIKAEA